MESRAEYLTTPTGRPGKIFVGGYIDSAAANRLRKACDVENITMIDLLERMAERVTVDFAPLMCGTEGCACGHE